MGLRAEGDGPRLVVHGVDDGQRLQLDATGADDLAPGLEALLDGDADALDDGPRLFAQLDKTVQGAAVGQEVIDQEHVLALMQELLGHDNVEVLLLGEGVNGGAVLLAVEVDGLILLGKHHRDVAKVARHHACDADAGGLDGENLVDLLSRKEPRPLGAHAVEELHVALMVEERVDLKDVAFLYRAVLGDVLLELLH